MKFGNFNNRDIFLWTAWLRTELFGMGDVQETRFECMISTGPEEISIGQKFLLLQSTVSLTRREEKMEGNSEKQAVQEVLGWNVTVTEPIREAWRPALLFPSGGQPRKFLFLRPRFWFNPEASRLTAVYTDWHDSDLSSMGFSTSTFHLITHTHSQIIRQFTQVRVTW